MMGWGAIAVWGLDKVGQTGGLSLAQLVCSAGEPAAGRGFDSWNRNPRASTGFFLQFSGGPLSTVLRHMSRHLRRIGCRS